MVATRLRNRPLRRDNPVLRSQAVLCTQAGGEGGTLEDRGALEQIRRMTYLRPDGAVPLLEAGSHSVQNLATEACCPRDHHKLRHWIDYSTQAATETLGRVLLPHISAMCRSEWCHLVVEDLLRATRSTFAGLLLKALDVEARCLACDKYGSRSVERLLEYCDAQTGRALEEHLVEHVDLLARNCYGKFVVEFLVRSASAADQKRLVRNVAIAALDALPGREKKALRISARMSKRVLPDHWALVTALRDRAAVRAVCKESTSAAWRVAAGLCMTHVVGAVLDDLVVQPSPSARLYAETFRTALRELLAREALAPSEARRKLLPGAAEAQTWRRHLHIDTRRRLGLLIWLR